MTYWQRRRLEEWRSTSRAAQIVTEIELAHFYNPEHFGWRSERNCHYFRQWRSSVGTLQVFNDSGIWEIAIDFAPAATYVATLEF